jgi:hypothetical protein
MSKYSTEPIGTPKAHYAPPEKGPFKCGLCVHYTEGQLSMGLCDHPEVKADADAGHIKRNKEGKAIVEANGCCNYFR